MKSNRLLLFLSLFCSISTPFSCNEKKEDNIKDIVNKVYYSLKLSTNNEYATNYSVDVQNMDKIEEGTLVTIKNEPGYYKISQILDENNQSIYSFTNINPTSSYKRSYSFNIFKDTSLKLVFTYDIDYYINTYPFKEKNGKANIILMAGQSNMVGWDAAYSSLSSETLSNYRSDDTRIMINYNCEYYSSVSSYVTNSTFNRYGCGGFVKVDFGQGMSKSYFGPEVGLAKQLRTNSNDNYYLIKTANGSASLVTHWNPDNYNLEPASSSPPYMYKLFIQNIDACLRNFKRNNITPNIVALCWGQGERDSMSSSGIEASNNYGNNLIKLQNAIKERYSKYLDSNFKWISAGVKITDRWTNAKIVNTHLKNNSDVYISESENLAYINSSHFTASSYLQIGELFGKAVLGTYTS